MSDIAYQESLAGHGSVQEDDAVSLCTATFEEESRVCEGVGERVSKVIKRDRSEQAFDRTKFVLRIASAVGSEVSIDKRNSMGARLADSVINELSWPVKSKDLDLLACNLAAQLTVEDPAYAVVATNIELDTIYRETESKFSRAMVRAQHLLSKSFADLVHRNKDALDVIIREGRDSYLSFLALRSLKSSYFLRDSDTYYERPQYTWLRTALFVHGDDLSAVRQTYDLISQLRFMPASPILFNSGTLTPQLSSCFLMPAGPHVEELFDVLANAANVSQGGGGLGIGLESLPCQGASGKSGPNPRLVPILKLLDSSADVIEKGSNNRPSAITTYIEPWHPDVLSFVRMKRVSGSDAAHTDRLFYGLWVNDLFMEWVEEDKAWTLFCPSDAPQLSELFGDAFDLEYEKLERLGKGRKTVKARELWQEILTSQIESGGPFVMFKDSINEKSNHRHIGTVTQSNLCTEIVQYCGSDEVAVCNLASVVLPSFVKEDGTFDFASLEAVVRHMVLFLNRVLLRTSSPCEDATRSMTRHRAIAIGVQGLADTFARMAIPFDSDSAFKLNAEVAESIYYCAIDASCDQTRLFGTYPTFTDSPAYNGWLQIHHWDNPRLTGRYNWGRLTNKVVKGMANSMVVAYMPTAGTSQLTGCSECFEPYTSLIYSRKLASGQFTVIPQTLVDRLQDMDLWTEEVINAILASDGSIQKVASIPKNVRDTFKTAWEIDPSVLIKMAAARQPFICQSQSMSLFFQSPSIVDVSKAIFMAWRLGLKTGMYYLRTKPAARPQPITLPVGCWASAPAGECVHEQAFCVGCTA